MFGAYVQDEVRVFPWLLVNAGARVDRYPSFGSCATPRIGVVLLPRPQTAIKLLHGRIHTSCTTSRRHRRSPSILRTFRIPRSCGRKTLLLERAGHVVVLAETGIAAVDAFMREPFDLILMDLQMPEMGGIEATTEICALEGPNGSHTPIVALTAHAMQGDRERCARASMDG
jgi:Response regulator receiver domain